MENYDLRRHEKNEAKICVGQYFMHTADAGEHASSVSECCEIRPESA